MKFYLNRKGLALVSGPVLAVLVALLVPYTQMPEGAGPVLCAASWMLCWWITDAVPLGVTSVLPIALFPLMGVAGIEATTAPYGSHYVFLFMGGFLIAIALERWNLHRRFALQVLVLAGGKPRRLIGGFMLATAALSMWISNTATTLMMLPIALSVADKVDLRAHPRFAVALLLGTAYAANIGGMATLVGTPPNVAMAGILERDFDFAMPFFEWMLMAMPFAVILLGCVYFLLTRVLCRVSKEDLKGGIAGIRQELSDLGAWTVAELRVALVFGGTAIFWIGRRWMVDGWGWSLNDTTIAMTAGILLFVLPAGVKQQRSLLIWEDAKRLPWDILLLFGGGLTLANALKTAGVLEWAAGSLAANSDGSWWLLLAVFLLVALLLTEVMSNLALTVIMVPVVGQIALKWGLDPLIFVIPVTLASSCAFMLPMATPPNAIIFGSGKIRMATMVGVGFVLNLVAVGWALAWGIWVIPEWIQLL